MSSSKQRSTVPSMTVARALADKSFPARVFLVAVGKAAYRMAAAALDVLPVPVADGVVISKYGHLGEPLPGLRFFEAGHPVPDDNSVIAGEAALKLTENLRPDDTVLFLLSGGGSALFEKPLIPLAELQDVTKQLLACGADIVEINTIRKRLSAVKGGKFAVRGVEAAGRHICVDGSGHTGVSHGEDLRAGSRAQAAADTILVDRIPHFSFLL